MENVENEVKEIKSYKSLTEVIKVIGSELDLWELKLKQDEEYKRQSAEMIAKDRERKEMFSGLVLWILKKLDEFGALEGFIVELKEMLLVEGKVPEMLKELPIEAFYGMIEEQFLKSITLVEKYRNEEKVEGKKFMGKFKKEKVVKPKTK